MDHHDTIHSSETFHGTNLDLGKLKIILRKNWPWILFIFILINSAAYVVIRYSKNVYRSDSEIKLNIKSDASEFGIRKFTEEPDVSIISGEIEIIESKLFLNRVLDESDFEVSFISVGRVLNTEMFTNSPAIVHVLSKRHDLYNTPIYFTPKNENQFLLSGFSDQEITANYNEKLRIGNLELLLEKNHSFVRGDEIGYYFLINSRDVLLNYLGGNLIAEPLNFNANTIRVSFQDNNPYKAQAVLNKIDTTYLKYSNEQKNLANKQKIDWLSDELSQIESRMEV
jgi:tyrosine-protein kinase Etk/Wzc